MAKAQVRKARKAYSKEKIISVLADADIAGVTKAAKMHKVFSAQIYAWRKKYGQEYKQVATPQTVSGSFQSGNVGNETVITLPKGMTFNESAIKTLQPKTDREKLLFSKISMIEEKSLLIMRIGVLEDEMSSIDLELANL